MGNFDLILEKIGPFGRYQKLFWFLCSLTIIPAGIQNVMNAYLAGTPDHWCHVQELASLSVEEQRNITATADAALLEENGEDSSCAINDIDYKDAYEKYKNNETIPTTNKTVICTVWKYDYTVYGPTIVTEWDLVCSKSTLTATAQSIYMLGFLLGALIFGHLSDRYGRKMTLCSSCMGIVLFGVISAFTPEFWSHVVLRMLNGVCTAGALAIGFVMSLEFIGTGKRVIPGLSAQIFFASGYMLLALIAFLVRNYIWTNFVLSILCIFFVSYWWVLPRSARWLMSQGRLEEAKVELKKAAKLNGAENVDIDSLIDENCDQSQKGVPHEPVHYTLLDLLKTPNMRKKTLNAFFNWFVTSMVYYGLTMGSTELGGDPYLNMFISGVMECAAVVVMILVLDRLGRRIPLATVLITAGVACITGGLLPKHMWLLRSILSMIGKFGVSGSFTIIYVYSAELFPTVVRTIGVGGGSMSARIGGILAPYVAELGIFWPPLPTIIFGVSALAAGTLSLMFPETMGQKLPESLEEGEEFGKNAPFFQCLPPKANQDDQEMKNVP